MRVILTIARVKTGSLASYVGACRTYAAAMSAEAGCLRFDILRDDADPARICLVETYGDQAAYDAHLASSHFRSWRDEVKDWYAEPPTVIRGSAVPSEGGPQDVSVPHVA